MYWEKLGFGEPPFALTPNPDFLFLSSHHQEALAHLLYGVENRVGFIELSGEVGAGKTTVIRTLLRQLDPEKYRSALIFNPGVTPTGLLQEINRELALPCGGSDTASLLHELNTLLLAENSAGRTVLLVIDEAQNLSPEVLEQVRLISNLETERTKLIQIILVGQPELRKLLARDDLRQLYQRITVRYHLEPMSCADSRDYIRHRLRVAGGGREQVAFSAAAMRRIFRFSKGLPRLINAVCDRALLLAYLREKSEVTGEMARRAASDIRKEERRGSRPLRVAAAVAVSAAVLLLFQFRQQPVPTAAPPPPLTREGVLALLAAVPETQNRLDALNAVFGGWGASPATAAPGRGGELYPLARQRGFSVTEVPADPKTLARMDSPVLLRLTLPAGGMRLIAVTSLREGRATISPALQGRTTISEEELALLRPAGATILWKNFYGIPTRLKPGETDRRVKALQELLKGAGVLREASGTFDRRTVEAITAFQRVEGLEADGRPGEKTLLLLYRRGGGFFPPSLGPGGRQERQETEGKG